MWLIACAPPGVVVDGYALEVDEAGALSLRRAEDDKLLVEDLRFATGTGNEQIEFSFGNYRVSGDSEWSALRAEGDGALLRLVDDAGDARGSLTLQPGPTLALRGDGDRLRWDAACTGDDHFAGLGEHAMDVDHVGQAFALWVSEPGIGKDPTEEPDEWPVEGARHASSMPDPFLLRPEPYGLLVETMARVEVDLCTGDRWTVDAWDDDVAFAILDADSTLDVVRARNLHHGPPRLPPDWAFAPWNDAVRGEARVREVATTLRAAGAPSGVIWTEDWKGAEETGYGYHLLPEWELDEDLYPPESRIDEALEALGFKWFAYFSPFLGTESSIWEEASAYAVQDAAGEPYTFFGATLGLESVLDLSREDARAWALDKMAGAKAAGFDGWMADYAEWVPPDAVLAHADPVADHNAYTLWWQAVNAEALGDEGAFFSRSGWRGTATLAPIHWPGDQRTSFDADDGLPSVIPAMIGDALAGFPLTGSDIAGYQSVGNDPSTEELWLRWCALGAWSPVMRTHHGAFAEDNVQFDSSDATLAQFTRQAREHMALFPWRRGLAQRAVEEGTPVIAPLFLHHPDEAWSRTDAYLFGELLVAPVVEAGVIAREVRLPAGTTWYDLRSGTVAEGGLVDAPLEEIPVFAPAGAILPRYSTVPDSLVDGPLDGLLTRADVEGARTVTVYAGAPGSFTEADGTTYETDGVATESGTSSARLATGELSAGGLRLRIAGPVERDYTLVVVR